METRLIYLRDTFTIHSVIVGDGSISHLPADTYGTLSGNPEEVLRAAYALSIGLEPLLDFFIQNEIPFSNEWMVEIQSDLIINIDWAVGVWLSRGGNIKYNGTAYTVSQSHQTQEGWEPPNVPALFFPVPILYPGENYPRWRQPLASEDAYKKDERVTWNGSDWKSNIDANVFEPGVSQWTDLNVPAGLPAWVQPVGAQDAYQIGAEVSHNGQNWRSTAANNVWAPGVFGWVVF